MKIGILGTRGIPNHYGGFEQFAEFFATYAAGQLNGQFVGGTLYGQGQFNLPPFVGCLPVPPNPNSTPKLSFTIISLEKINSY
jgi:hypothetical protein